MDDIIDTDSIAGVELQLAAAGLTVIASGCSDAYARLQLGERGVTAAGFIPMVLRVAPGVKPRAAWDAAIERAALKPLMGRVSSGWTETDADGASQYLLGVEVGTVADGAAEVWRLASSGLAGWKASTAAGGTIAEIKLGKAAVAPSEVQGVKWTRISGATGDLTRVTVSELLGLGAALDEASAFRDSNSLVKYDTRANAQRTNAARDFVNRSVSERRVLQALNKAGWTELGTGAHGERLLSAPGGASPTSAVAGTLLPRGGMLTSNTAVVPAPFAAGCAYRPFDVLAAVEHGGDADGAAEAMLATGEARIEAEMFVARDIVRVDAGQPTAAIVAEIIRAISRARSKWDETIPLAMQHMVPGTSSLRGIISVTPTGALRVWEKMDGLISAAVQLVEMGKTPDPATGAYPVRKYIHTIDAAIRGQVTAALLEPGTLPTVDYVGTEPMITASGTVVSEHGYSASDRTLLAIPENQRGTWTRIQVGRPTKEEAQESLDWLCEEVLPDFPFAALGDQARALALLLTGVARPITQQSPLYIANGSEVGTGKSLLLMIVRLIASGTTASNTWVGGHNGDTEDLKGLVAGIREGGSRVWMHNDEASIAIGRSGRLESGMVTRLTTALDGEARERVLGVNESASISGHIFTAAGNGILPGGDLPRRTLIITMLIKSGVLAVERKGFRHADIIGWVKLNRPEILRHVFVVLAHGIQSRSDVPSHGFTGAWPRIVLGSLSHLTMHGQSAYTLTMDAMAAQLSTDSQSEDWGPLLAELSALTKGTSFEAKHARMWAESMSLEAPDRIRFARTTNEAGQNRSWSAALKTMVGKKVTADDYRYRLQHEATSGKASKKFLIERFDDTGDIAPEAGVPAPIPVAALRDFSF
jgi:hypothetical protein